mgnify:CR=1 FL=1
MERSHELRRLDHNHLGDIFGDSHNLVQFKEKPNLFGFPLVIVEDILARERTGNKDGILADLVLSLEHLGRLLERRFKEEQQRLKARQPRQPEQSGTEAVQPEVPPKGEASGKAEGAKGDEKGTEAGKSSGILTPEEEKAYRKVRDKVMAILRTERMEARMKEWIEQLKKDAMIEVKL